MKVRAFAAPIAAAALLAALPVAGASASRASVKAALKAALNADNAQIAAANSHLSTALAEYDSSKNAPAVEAAIGEELTVLRSLRATVKAQSTDGHPLIHYGKTEMLYGLNALMASYGHLSNTFADATTNPKKAKQEALRYLKADQRAERDLQHGEKALSH